MSITVVVFVAVGLLFAGISLPLIRRRVPPNPTYGLRVAATFADEWVWYEANARSGRDFFALGIVVMVVAVVLPFAVQIGESAYAPGRVKTSRELSAERIEGNVRRKGSEAVQSRPGRPEWA